MEKSFQLIDLPLRAATLAVGTEITDGQISDRNSQWLAARLTKLGFIVDQFRAVPDDREKIETALRDLALQHTWVFVTGGLGPTSDDFTRECVAKVTSDGKLAWDEPSWQQILERLAARGSVPTENQKQQCYFPEGSQILKNSRGTANAFAGVLNLSGRDVHVFALPGPPLEIEAVWNEGLSGILESYIAKGRLEGRFKPSRRLKIVRTMGLGEGALADRVEKLIDQAVADHVKSQGPMERPEVGYRAHAPYVEIKLWGTEEQAVFIAGVSEKIKTEFKNYFVNEDDEDAADRFLEKVLKAHKGGRSIAISDQVSRGLILQRLFDRAQNLGRKDLQEALDRAVRLTVGPWRESLDDENFGMKMGASELTLEIQMPEEVSTVDLPKLAQSLTSDRGRKWAIEFALLEWGNC